MLFSKRYCLYAGRSKKAGRECFAKKLQKILEKGERKRNASLTETGFDYIIASVRTFFAKTRLQGVSDIKINS